MPWSVRTSIRALVSRFLPFVSFVVSIVCAACGGGGSGSQPPSSDFSLVVSPSTTILTAGQSATFQVSVQGSNGFSGSVTVQVSNLPAGITLSTGNSFSVSATAAKTVTVNCASSMSAGNYSVQLSATSGSLSHSGSATFTVQVPNADFSLSASPSSITAAAGAKATFQLSLSDIGTFSAPVQVQIAGLPAGATEIPATPFSVTAAQPEAVTIAIPAGISPGSYTVTITGSSGSLTHSISETLSVEASVAPPSRADFVRTDDSPMSAAYDRTHQRVYVSNPIAGTVDVISSTTYQLLRRIVVPSPAGLDITPDDSTVFVGTSTQAVYALDTATLALTSRFIVPAVPLSGNSSQILGPTAPVAASDGSVLISTTHEILKWNPATGASSTVFSDAPPMAFGYGLVSPMAHSADHSKIILSNDNDASTVYVYDTQQNQFSAPLTVQGYAYSVAANPDGTQFAIVEALDAYNGENFIVLYDANLNQTASIPGSGYILFSADGKYLYVVGTDGYIPAVVTLDAKSLNVVGIAPSYASNIAAFMRVPPLIQERPLVADETGRVFGRADHGLAIDDATDFRTYTGSENFPIYDIISMPDDGPLEQQQQLQIETQGYTAIPSIWFGSLAATGTSIAGSYMATTAPAYDQTGPVNIRINGTDHVQAWIPQAYTYGAILSPQPDMAGPSKASAELNIFGYGIVADDGVAADTAITLGNSAATVSSAQLYPSEEPYPFPLWHVKAETPQMPVGAADLTVATKWAKVTQPAAYHSIDISSYALDGSVYGIAYDPARQRIYLSATDHVDVFSLSSRTFLPTIAIPALNNAHQLGGLTVTPDGKWLVVSNYADGSVAVVDPDNPSNATAVAVGNVSNPYMQGPSLVAATSNGKVFVGLAGPPNAIAFSNALTGGGPRSPRLSGGPRPADVTPLPTTWLLDLTTMSATAYGAINSPESPFMAASPDGEQVCFSGLYQPLTLYQSATDSVTYGPGIQGPNMCAANGNIVATVEVSGGDVQMPSASDLSLRQLSISGIPDFQLLQLPGIGFLGLAVDSTGSLIYQPILKNIALWDAHTGELREVISTPSNLIELFSGTLLINQAGDQVYVVTNNGLTIVQLDTLPLAIGSITTSGASWSIAGTGFVSGTTLSIDGKTVSIQFTDAHHLQVPNAPELAATHTITLTNPDGHSYTYDAAFLR